MGESLTQRRRVGDEGLRIVKPCGRGKKNPREQYLSGLTVPLQKAPANSVPAAAVIRRVLTLFGITGRKARVGGLSSQM
jgi:hypothetical protein